MRMSFGCVPEEMLRDCQNMFLAAQQMCLALLITDIETAKVVYDLWPNEMQSPEKVLRWAQTIREEFDRIEWAKAVASPIDPLTNTHPGFFVGPLQSLKYPGMQQKTLYALVEEIGQDFLRRMWCFPNTTEVLDDTFKINQDAFVAEMVKRGATNCINEKERVPVSEEIARSFVLRGEVSLYIIEMQIINLLNKERRKEVLTKGALRYYIARNMETKESLLLRAGEMRAAEAIAYQRMNADNLKVKVLELDAESWITLEG